jgi:hypothetical protein
MLSSLVLESLELTVTTGSLASRATVTEACGCSAAWPHHQRAYPEAHYIVQHMHEDVGPQVAMLSVKPQQWYGPGRNLGSSTYAKEGHMHGNEEAICANGSESSTSAEQQC